MDLEGGMVGKNDGFPLGTDDLEISIWLNLATPCTLGNSPARDSFTTVAFNDSTKSFQRGGIALFATPSLLQKHVPPVRSSSRCSTPAKTPP